MPKRKLTPARRAAIVKWQLAGARARAEKAGKAKARNTIPRSEYGNKRWRGPVVDLYHATTPANAKLIRKNGFQWVEGRNLSMSGIKDPIWFSTKRPRAGSDVGDWVHEKFGGKKVKPVLFSVRVRYKMTKRDKHTTPGSKAIPSRVVSAAYLRGKKIREIK